MAAVLNWGPSTYPATLDTVANYPDLIDLTHDVIVSHPNALRDAIITLEAKLGITNDPITGLGGVSFSSVGKAANPGAAGDPTIWVDNSLGAGFGLFYTNDSGITYDLLDSFDDWAVATDYGVNREVLNLGLRFRCLSAHTSDATNFFNDLDKWECVSSNGFIANLATHGFAAKDVIYKTTGNWTKAQSNAVGTLSDPPTVVVGASTNYFLAAQDGNVTFTSHGLTVGSIYYLSDATPALLTVTAPVTVTSYLNPVVKVFDANTLTILPYKSILVSTSSSTNTFAGLTDGPGGYTTANAIYTTNGTPDAVIETTVILIEAANTFNLTKGTASLDIAAGAALDVNANLTVSGVSSIDQDVTSGSAPTFTADNFSDGGGNAIITTTQETNFEAAYTHVSSTGVDHGYINQDVTSTGTPSFTSVTATTVNSTTLDTNVAAAGLTLSGTTLSADGTDTHIDITITPKGNAGIVIASTSAPAVTTNKLYNNSGVLFWSGSEIFVSGSISLNDLTDGAAPVGSSSVFLGAGAGTLGSSNTGVGVSALASTTATGSLNSAFGYFALSSLTTGDYNAGLGTNAGVSLTTGSSSLFIGANSGYNATVGSQNTIVGSSAGGLAATNIGSGSVCIGYHAGNNTSLTSNQLWIANTNTTTPLVYGVFPNTSLTFTANDLYLTGISHFSSTSEFSGNPQLLDDVNLIFGDSSDAAIVYDVTNHTVHQLVLALPATCNSLLVTTKANQAFDHAHALQTDPTIFVHSASASTTEWISLSHDQTNGRIQTGAGGVYLGSGNPTKITSPVNGDVFISGRLETASTFLCAGAMIFYSDVNHFANQQLGFGGTGASDSVLIPDETADQLIFSLGSTQGRQLVITESGLRYQDHGHTIPTDPTLFIHSSTSPLTDATQWGSFSHDQTDFINGIGTGGRVTNYEDPVSLADDASFNLPSASIGYGFFMCGDEYAYITWAADGSATLVTSSTNVVTTDTDTNLCFFDGGTYVTVRNRLGAEYSILYDYHYTTP